MFQGNQAQCNHDYYKAMTNMTPPTSKPPASGLLFERLDALEKAIASHYQLVVELGSRLIPIADPSVGNAGASTAPPPAINIAARIGQAEQGILDLTTIIGDLLQRLHL